MNMNIVKTLNTTNLICETKTRAEVTGLKGSYRMDTIPREIVSDKEWYDISCPLELGYTQSRCITNLEKCHNQMKYM